MMAVRVLVVSILRPSPSGDNGGARSLAWRIQALAATADVRMLHLDDGGPRRADVAFDATPVGVDPRGPARTGRLLLGLVRGVPGYVAGNHSTAMTRAIDEAVTAWRPDVVQFEHAASAQWARGLARRPRDARPALVLVDLDPREADTRSHRPPGRRRGPREVLEGRAWRRWSRLAPTLVDAVVVFTDADRAAVLRAVPGTRVEVIPPAGPAGGPPEPGTRDEDSRMVMFVGNYDHAPNVDAARRLAGVILPAVRARVAGAQLVLAGRGDPGVRDDPAAGVRVRGWVDDLDALRGAAAVEAMPIRLGGGVRVKAVEALRAGSAVVASRLALEGLDVADGREVLVAEDDDEFADRIAGLLLDTARRRELGAAAVTWARNPRGATAGEYGRLYTSLGVPAA